MIKIIVAMSPNRVIGMNGKMPWHYSDELKFFKETTSSHTVIMGRKTYQAIGEPLPNRQNIVFSQSLLDNSTPNLLFISNIEQLKTKYPFHFQKYENIITDHFLFVIGGAEIYRLMAPYCHELIISHIRNNFIGDTYFPEIEQDFKRKKEILSTDQFYVSIYSR